MRDGETIALPPCANAQITFTPKEDAREKYAFENLTITSQAGVPLTLTPHAQRYTQVTMRLFFHPLMKNVAEDEALDGILQQTMTPTSETWQPASDETIRFILLLTRMDIPHIIMREYDATSLSQLQQGVPLRMYEGTYHLSFLGMVNYTELGSGVRIPEKKGCGGISIPLIDVCVFGEYTIPEFTLNATLFTLFEKDITIPPGARGISLHLPVYDPASIPKEDRDIRDLNALAHLSEYVGEYPSLGVSIS